MAAARIPTSEEFSKELGEVTDWEGVQACINKYAYTDEELDAAGVPVARYPSLIHQLLIEKLLPAFRVNSELNPLLNPERINLLAFWILSVQNAVAADTDTPALPDLAKEIVDAYVRAIRERSDGRDLLSNRFYERLRNLGVVAAPPIETRADETQSLAFASLSATSSDGGGRSPRGAAGGAAADAR